MSDKLMFAYLYYAVYNNTPCLMGVYKTAKAALAALSLTKGVYMTCQYPRVAQRMHADGQYWYVEKHVMRSAV